MGIGVYHNNVEIEYTYETRRLMIFDIPVPGLMPDGNYSPVAYSYKDIWRVQYIYKDINEDNIPKGTVTIDYIVKDNIRNEANVNLPPKRDTKEQRAAHYAAFDIEQAIADHKEATSGYTG